jgi:hypothetical protein
MRTECSNASSGGYEDHRSVFRFEDCRGQNNDNRDILRRKKANGNQSKAKRGD